MPFAPTISSVELSVMTTVKQFLDQMSLEGRSLKESTPEHGNKILSEAIAKGISTALTDPVMQTAFSIIIDTNVAAVIPIGSTAFASLQAQVKAKVIPNPNLKP